MGRSMLEFNGRRFGLIGPTRTLPAHLLGSLGLAKRPDMPHVIRCSGFPAYVVAPGATADELLVTVLDVRLKLTPGTPLVEHHRSALRDFDQGLGALAHLSADEQKTVLKNLRGSLESRLGADAQGRLASKKGLLAYGGRSVRGGLPSLGKRRR
jgi:hypothetical protein